MTLERKISNFFNLTDKNWMRHANPWSVWTRYTVFPIIILALWCRLWIGWWSLIPVVLSILWTLFNPIVFRKPSTTRNWASKAVMGERVYINRDKIQLPKIHKSPIHKLLIFISSVGMFLSVWAIIYYSIWGAVLGTSLVYLGKSWYLDRMVWLYEDMKNSNQEYKSWDY